MKGLVHGGVINLVKIKLSTRKTAKVLYDFIFSKIQCLELQNRCSFVSNFVYSVHPTPLCMDL
jgi:hypothetical protein